MGIRLKDGRTVEVVDIRLKQGDKIVQVSMVKGKSGGRIVDFWEMNNSSFLDKFGFIFYDKNGVPFQGKQ